MKSEYSVGDKVVPIEYPLKSTLCTVSRIIEHGVFNENGEYLYSSFTYYLLEWCYDCCFNSRTLRFATEEELKIGKIL